MKRHKLTASEAIAMLPDGELTHTFTSPAANVLVGRDWKRIDIIEALRDGAELSGERATAMGHGMVIVRLGPLFIATKEAK